MSTMKAKHFHLIDDMDIAALTFAVIERVEAFVETVKRTLTSWIRPPAKLSTKAHRC